MEEGRNIEGRGKREDGRKDKDQKSVMTRK
jgi:hypothetical protein